MAVIYMDHPKHGTKVACMEDEAKADEAQGWVRRSVAALLRPAATVAANDVQKAGNALHKLNNDGSLDPVAELLDLRTRWAAKFGTKPHHKKTAATLRAELEG